MYSLNLPPNQSVYKTPFYSLCLKISICKIKILLCHFHYSYFPFESSSGNSGSVHYKRMYFFLTQKERRGGCGTERSGEGRKERVAGWEAIERVRVKGHCSWHHGVNSRQKRGEQRDMMEVEPRGAFYWCSCMCAGRTWRKEMERSKISLRFLPWVSRWIAMWFTQ